MRDYYSVDNDFIEGVVQQGVSNQLTLNLGTRQAKDYQAWLAGGVWASWLGAVGVNATWSSARVLNNQREQGWRAETSYSKTFSSGTNLVLAAYRYSTEGFRDLQDVLGVRREAKNGISYYSDTLQQRNRLSAAVSQSMGDWGMLNLNASTADYYNNQSRITQIRRATATNGDASATALTWRVSVPRGITGASLAVLVMRLRPAASKNIPKPRCR